MEQLKIILLGNFQVIIDGQRFTRFGSDKGQALLAYLAVNGERPFKRETLAALFWPDSSAKDGRNNLRQTLFKLNRAIPQRTLPLFRTTRTTVQFNRQPNDWIDIEAIPAADADSLLTLYTAPFLDNFYLDSCYTFEEWTLTQREWIHQQAMNRFYLLTEEAMAAGDYETAHRLAARQISLDRWREAARRQLMRVLAAQGKQSAALAQYETCRRVLEEELGVEPAQETTTLYHTIRAKMHAPVTPAPRYNLPTNTVPFVGRTAETERINGRLSTPACRLLTLIGPGGIGKTRLALHAASALTETFRDGIFFVPLAPITPAADPEKQIIQAMATAVDLRFSGPTPPRRQLAGWLQGKNILLLIDNAEHMLAGAGAMAYLLQTIPADANAPFKMLVTSRQRLDVAEEWVIPVQGMAYPATDDANVEQFDAMKLFWQRARMINPDFSFSIMAKPFAAQICRMAGGHPLAIMLAASWTRVIPCAEIAAEMRRDLEILQTRDGNVESRHQDLRAVLYQSWGKLSAEAQRSLLKLSLFPGGFTRKAGTAVAQATLFILQELIDYAFLSRDGDRYHIHELLRQFAADLLTERGDEAAAKQEMMGYYGRFLQEKTAAFYDKRHRAAILAVRTELDNIRICWQWACEMGDNTFLYAAMESIASYYEFHGLFQEGGDLFAAAEGVMGEHVDDARYHRFQARHGTFLHYIGELEQAETLFTSALAQAETADDEAEISYCLRQLWYFSYSRGRQDEAADYARRALAIARRTGDILLLAIATNGMAGYHSNRGELEIAEQFDRESLAAYQQLGDPLKEVSGINGLALNILRQGRNEEAEQLLRDCLKITGRYKTAFAEMKILTNLAAALGNQNRYEEAREVLEQALAISRSHEHRHGEADVLSTLGEVYNALGSYNLAYTTLHKSQSIYREMDDLWGMSITQIYIGQALLAQDKYAEAEASLEQGLETTRKFEWQLLTVIALAILAELRLKQGDGETAVNLAQQVLNSSEAMDDTRAKAQAVLDALNPDAAPPKSTAE